MGWRAMRRLALLLLAAPPASVMRVHARSSISLSTHILPTIIPKSSSGVTKPDKTARIMPQSVSSKGLAGGGGGGSGGANKGTAGGVVPKGNARPDLLFDLTCTTYNDPPPDFAPQGCIGVGPRRACQRSLETDKGGAMEHPRGEGGPTGCKEAFLTVMGDDGFLAGVLLLLHTVRKYATADRDFVVIVSTEVTTPTIELLLAECVRVVQLDPFYQNDLAKQLVSKSERYKSGYWVIKMFVWRLEEYSKLVYIDGDVYFRQSADELFCAPVSDQAPIAVTPRSSQDMAAGFNAGMFIYAPSRTTYERIMEKFLAMSEADLFATSEQDFLNDYFKGCYNLIPIDYLMKHRRMVKEKSLWDLDRVHGYHMNGNPKPWSPAWRTACAYPGDHQRYIAQYENFYLEWWRYYYEYIGEPVPESHADYALRPREDPTRRFENWDPKSVICSNTPQFKV